MGKENKVNFGLRNAHFATFEVTEAGTIVYDTPIPIPGSVELALEPRGDVTEFYADNILYYSAPNNQGYDGTLTIANIPEAFAIACLSEVLDADDKVINEVSGVEFKPFALLFEFDGDEKAVRHALYSCTANRPTVGSSTTTNSKEPNTNELSFISSPRITDNHVKTKTTAATTEEIYNKWFQAVYQKEAVTIPEA